MSMPELKWILSPDGKHYVTENLSDLVKWAMENTVDASISIPASSAELTALKEAYRENQNLHCFSIKGRAWECLDRQTRILRQAIARSEKGFA